MVISSNNTLHVGRVLQRQGYYVVEIHGVRAAFMHRLQPQCVVVLWVDGRFLCSALCLPRARQNFKVIPARLSQNYLHCSSDFGTPEQSDEKRNSENRFIDT